MTDQEMRVAIAQACGYRRGSLADLGYIAYDTDNELWIKGSEGWEQPPDYLNDLNAMHEAEKVLTSKEKNAYLRLLEKNIDLNGRGVFATAKQRAEAFCKTVFPERFKE